MWLFTTLGFFSVVCTPNNSERMQIRARCRRHLDNLCRRFKIRPQAIRETLEADYRFRLIVDREDWEWMACSLAQDIDYSNFKTEVGHGDEDYADALMSVWGRMLQLQPGRPQRRGINRDIHDSALPPPTTWGLPGDDVEEARP